MSIFEILFIAALAVLALFLSQTLGQIFSVNAWVFAVPLIIAVVFGIRRFGLWLARRRRQGKLPFKRLQNFKDDHIE